MALIADLFERLRDSVGTPALVLVAWAFIFLEFAKSARALYDEGDPYRAGIASIAVVLFVLGVFVGLLHVLRRTFRVRPGQGFVHGILAGVCGGIAAGSIYGKARTGWDLDLVLQSVVLSIPPGAVFGLVLSFCDPRATLSMGGRLTAVAIFGTGVMIPVGFLVVRAGLQLPGAVVSFWVVEVGVGTFTMAMAALWLWPVVRPPARYVRLVALGVLLAGLGWIIPQTVGFDLSWDWLDPKRHTARQVATQIGFLPLWSGLLYLAVTANTWFTRALDRLVTRPAVPAAGSRQGS